MSISSVFNRGLDGLNVSQRGLAAAANNIANANTKGYSRQQIQISSTPSNSSDASLSGGAQVTGMATVTDSFIEMQLFSSANSFGTVDGRKKTLSQLEELFNESQNQGLGKNINDFFNSWSDLANNPSNNSARLSVRDRAVTLAAQFNSLSQSLNAMKKNLSGEISTRLQTVNGLATKIALLNDQIVKAGGSADAPDLAVQRTYALRQLSEEMNISYYEDTTGAVQVQCGTGGSIVFNSNAGSLSVGSDSLSPGGVIAINLNFAGSSSSTNVTSQITTGRLGGNLIDRNTTLNTQLTNIDALAYQLATQFNAAYTTGYGLDSSTGNNFFTPLASATGAAGLITVDASVMSDVRTIAAAQQDPTISGPADNRKALQLVGLQNNLTMTTGTETFAQNYQSIVGTVGVTAATVNQDYETRSNLVNQMDVQRESISGVNMDEEGASIMQFQKAFQAASRLMSVANDLMDTLLKI
jgi:flagellar hook-associated protein 1 FlgK